jgi:hypothetical protein
MFFRGAEDFPNSGKEYSAVRKAFRISGKCFSAVWKTFRIPEKSIPRCGRLSEFPENVFPQCERLSEFRKDGNWADFIMDNGTMYYTKAYSQEFDYINIYKDPFRTWIVTYPGDTIMTMESYTKGAQPTVVRVNNYLFDRKKDAINKVISEGRNRNSMPYRDQPFPGNYFLFPVPRH